MRVAISSPDKLFLDGLAALFVQARFQVVMTGTDSRECIRAAGDVQADLFVVDLWGAEERDIQFLLGAQTFGELRMILITDGERGLPAGFEVGVDRSDTGKTLLERATSLAGDAVKPARRGRGRPRMSTHGLNLSPREYDVAHLISQGYTNQRIAESMVIKEQSVKNLVSTVIRKLNCENRVQVALLLSGGAA